ncbi:MAG: hypothetical protein LBP74_10330 [Treponema sp.]|jgi:hypothetical protein|nr:hypothetical protein [Treponema sp.]
MASHVSPIGTFSLRKKMFPLFLTVFLFTLTALLPGCKHEPDPFVDDGKLNSGLIGTWKASGENDYGSWSDTYTIKTAQGSAIGIISHPEGYSWKNATIVHVFNFNETSGCLIVKYTAGNAVKYSAVYFKNLSDASVLLGDAFGPPPGYLDPAVDTLDEAITKFAPENASAYGGGDAQTGTPQIKQP